MGLEMLLKDGCHFVIIVSEAEWFATERDLDARFGHVAVVAAEEPAADEGIDGGLGVVFGKHGAVEKNHGRAGEQYQSQKICESGCLLGLSLSKLPHGGPKHRLRGFDRGWDGRGRCVCP